MLQADVDMKGLKERTDRTQSPGALRIFFGRIIKM